MDRALDDVISDRQRGGAGARGRRGRRTEDYPRDGVRKSTNRDDFTRLNRDWVHDRYDEYRSDRSSNSRSYQPERLSRGDPEPANSRGSGCEIRVENLHYDLTEKDIHELFERIGPVKSARLFFDRNDRSSGTARVLYYDERHAHAACRSFDGANAHGQPIRLKIVQHRRNPFDSVERPSRSLFERIEGGARNRSPSPDRPRHSNVSRPAPVGIDRYVPGDVDGRRRSPPRRRPGAGPRQGGRRTGERPQQTRGGRPVAGGRPKKTVEELDAEMADYFGGGGGGEEGHADNDASGGTGHPTSAGAHHAPINDDDIDMVE